MNPYQEKLKQFAIDDIMFSAVKQEFLSKCDLNVLFKNGADGNMPNTEVFDKGRAWFLARNIIEDTFKEIEKYKKMNVKEDSPIRNTI